MYSKCLLFVRVGVRGIGMLFEWKERNRISQRSVLKSICIGHPRTLAFYYLAECIAYFPIDWMLAKHQLASIRKLHKGLGIEGYDVLANIALFNTRYILYHLMPSTKCNLPY